MQEELYEIESRFYTFETDRCGNGGIGLAVYLPKKANPRNRVAVLALHAGGYMGFTPMVEMAKRGFVAAGVAPKHRDLGGWLLDCKTCLEFLRGLPGVEKVVLMGHSQGGCLTSAYQYLAENGDARFRSAERLVPFPELGQLPPADGLMLLDANYGIMSVLALDPGVRSLAGGGYDRIPELDLFNPENGYAPGGSRYSQEFVRRYQRAQIRMYKDLLAYAKERVAAIEAGRGRFADDEPILIPGGAGGSSNNKPFCMDVRLLGRTSKPQPLLHPDGSISREVVWTTRKPVDSVHSSFYKGGAATTSVRALLAQELRFDDDFGYDECNMWGADGGFNPLSTRENVKGIRVPLLCQGNTASHEFVNTEFNFDAAVSKDKEIILVEGSCHDFSPVEARYGDTHATACRYFAQWLAKPGRFLE